MNHQENNTTQWLFEITPKNNFFSLNLKEVWQYRDFDAFREERCGDGIQTNCLGTAVVFDTTLFTSITFTIIFNNLAGIDRNCTSVLV
jgi:lipopolysaccharide transport system permease protein